MRKVILITIFLFKCVASVEQTIQTNSVIDKNIISLQIGYPIPESGSTFNRIYNGVFDVRIAYSRMKNKISFGGNISYSYFRISPQVLDIKGKMTIFAPGVTAGYKFKVSNKIDIHSLFKCGYDFVAFSGTDANGNSLTTYNEGGISLSPIVSIEYLIKNNISLGIAGSYEVIFQHFGNNSVYEESTIRNADIGLIFIYEL